MSSRKKLAEKDLKCLWALSGGICANPSCQMPIIEETNPNVFIVLGDQAHIIPHSEKGPRSADDRSSTKIDDISNLVLLCKTCHARADKVPDSFSSTLLRKWKLDHESRIKHIFAEEKYNNLHDLKKRVCTLLDENYYYFKEYGPKSARAEKSQESAFTLWQKHIVGNILPNNQSIINIIKNNFSLIPTDKKILFTKFQAHATAYEQHFIEPIEDYPLFPMDFAEYMHD